MRRRLTALAAERWRFGYRRLSLLLRRQGQLINKKRVLRIYVEDTLMVRSRGGRKRTLGISRPPAATLAPNERWNLDFVSDQMTDGRQFRILCGVDDCTRESLALVAGTSLSGKPMVRELMR